MNLIIYDIIFYQSKFENLKNKLLAKCVNGLQSLQSHIMYPIMYRLLTYATMKGKISNYL